MALALLTQSSRAKNVTEKSHGKKVTGKKEQKKITGKSTVMEKVKKKKRNGKKVTFRVIHVWRYLVFASF